jgi:glyoxylase-like metal-dependent hydrolase (beta-lactamase superfamily II)
MNGAATVKLPPGVVVVERGWLSSNSVLLPAAGGMAVVDSGYWTHAAQTVELVASASGGRPLTLLLNTHLHSDHCGGNAALQARYPQVRTLVPAGLARWVREWDTTALTYEPTGQFCPRFAVSGVLQPGSELQLAGCRWQVHGAPGHDPHSVVLFEAASRTLISADALWASGFGVVFPELEGESAFEDVARTLDLIQALEPAVVIPGHGPVFDDVSGALARARSRLAAYEASPIRHATHAGKVLLKFKLLEWQSASLEQLLDWASATSYFQMMHRRWFADEDPGAWVRRLAHELIVSGAARLDGDMLHNA